MIKQFILFCSGANTEVLSKCPTQEPRMVSIGLSVLLTAVLALFSSCYAMYFVFDNIFFSELFSIIWALMIFNLDRYIIISSSKEKKVLFFFPRILIAVIISITISKPVEIKIYEDLIMRNIYANNEGNLSKYKNDFDVRLSNISREIKETESGVYDYNNDIILKDITGKIKELKAINRIIRKDSLRVRANNRTIAILSKKEAKRRDEVMNAFKVKESQKSTHLNDLYSEMAGMNKKRDSLFLSYSDRVSVNKDLISMLTSLSEVKSQNDTVAVSSGFITALFLLIETSPILIKMMTKNGVYEELVANQERVILESKNLCDDIEKESLLKISKYNADMRIKLNQATTDYYNKKEGYLKKVEIDKGYDKKLTNINNC